MTDREEREEHIKRLEAALACEEKQFLGKCSKQTCDDNCALLYEQGNWGEWKETLRYAINSLKTDLKYDLLYEETSGQADKQADKPITQNCESCRYYGSRHKVCNYCYKCSLWTEQEPTTKNDVPDINVGEIEPITRNDCEHCSRTYGSPGCCTAISNKWGYSCKEGHEEYVRGNY